MPNDLPLPDDLNRLGEKRTGRDRRRRGRGGSQEDHTEGVQGHVDRRREQRPRREQRNFRALLDSDDDDDSV